MRLFLSSRGSTLLSGQGSAIAPGVCRVVYTILKDFPWPTPSHVSGSSLDE